MFLVDSHCHLNLLDLTSEAELDRVVQEARASGVGHFLNVSVSMKDFPALLATSRKYPFVSASVGLHPNEQEEETSLDELCRYAEDEKVVAIGETGLDYYRSSGELEWQRARFREHIRAAQKMSLSLLVHSRQAKADTIAILREEASLGVQGLLHCFTEDWEMAKQALDLGFYISFSGIVTFKNAKAVQEVARRLPLDRLLIETDAPYLAPVPNRGKPNVPAYVLDTARYLAALRGSTCEVIAEASTANFFRLFKRAVHV